MTVVLGTAFLGLAFMGAPGDPAWSSVLLLGVCAGLLVLDDTALAQTWFSQPLPAGVLTGLLCGDPLTGLAIGLPVQLILAGNLPVGQSFTGDPITAMVASVGAVVLSGRGVQPTLGAAPGETAALVGWMVLAVGLLSALGHLVVQAERRAHALWMREGHRTLRDGSLQRIERLHLRALLTTFARGFLTTVVLLLVLKRFWLPAFSDLPGFLRGALAMVPVLLPGLGLGTLIDRYGVRQSWLWLLAGGAVSFFIARVAA